MHHLTTRQPTGFFLYFLIPIFVYLIFIAVSRGIADVTVNKAQTLMNGWVSGKTVQTEEWNDAHTSLLSALSLTPENPDYLSLLGNLYEWRVARQALDSPELIENYHKALDYYQQALAKRPAFAFYWANIAVVKSILGEVDEAFYLAVDRALILGAWEPGVQLKIADATLRVWYLLDDHGWEQTVNNIERGLVSNAPTIMKKAKQVQVLNKLCGKLKRTEPVRKFCR